MASADSNTQALGTTLQMFGTFMSNQEESRGFKLNASEVLREGRLAAQRVREMGERVQGAQRVGFAKGGVEISGTALEVLAETVSNAETDALEIERTAALQARELRRAARKKETAGTLGLIGAVAGGAFGGPTGAALGGSLGTAIGGAQ